MTLQTPPLHTKSHVKVAIVGSGFGGIGTAIRLKQCGIHDFVILEKAGEVGGVWRDNSYPGAACDVPSHLYSFSFAPNPDWSHHYSPQPEIWQYLRHCVQQFGIQPHLRFDHEVRSARWNAEKAQWEIETSQNTYTASILVMATGALSEPMIPTLPGIEYFSGTTFHSARWNHDFNLQGKNVAVVGTGASAIQFVPKIQPLVAKLYLFQRTPAWILPRNDHAIETSERERFRRFPILQKFKRSKIYLSLEQIGIGFRNPWLLKSGKKTALRHLHAQISDPTLRAQLTPAYTIGCKRVLLSDQFYPAVAKPNVELMTQGIAKLRSHSFIDKDGIEHPLDAIIFATGFHVTDFPFAKHILGRAGLNLGELWAESPKAHVGTSVAGFPNFYLLQGPNTGLGHTSVIYMIEAQIEHILGAIRHMDGKNILAVEPKLEAQTAFVADVDKQMQKTVWAAGGCKSWYIDASGRVAALWPGSTFAFRRRVARFRAEEYQVIT